MKLLRKCQYKDAPGSFTVSGRLNHHTIYLLPGLYILLGLPALFEGYVRFFLISLPIVLIITLILLLIYNFSISINTQTVVIRLRVGWIPFKTITCRLQDLIIDHTDAKELTLISTQARYYEEMKKSIMFSYLVPWEVNYSILYIDYEGHEIDFNTYCDDVVWNKILFGLKKLEGYVGSSEELTAQIKP